MATPVRHVRVSDELWQAAKDKAWRERTTVGAAINAWLAEWVANAAPEPTKPKGSARKQPDLAPAADPRSLIRNLPSMR